MSKLFLVNPIAVRNSKKYLSDLLSTSFTDISLIETEKKGDSERYAYESTDSEVFAVGGDGTVRDVADGFCRRVVDKQHSDKPIFGIIPFGSGNDFVKTLYNKETNPKKIVSNIKNGLYNVKSCDVGKVNDMFFMNIASIGFDSEIVKNSEKFKKSRLLRRFSYILSLLYTVFRFKGIDVDIEIDGEKTSQKMLLLAVANGKYYGGGIEIAPDAKIDDGLFDVIYIPAIHPLKLFFLLPTIVKGKHVNHKEVTVIRGKNIKVNSKQGDIFINYDGELDMADYANFTIYPSLINIYAE